MPQNPDEYLSQTYIRFRDDSAAANAVTAEQKKKTWLMFADINNGYVDTFKTGGAYLDGNYNKSLLIQKDTVYRFNIDIDFESKKYDISISDGTNSISSAVENIELSEFDSIEIITVKSDAEYDMSVCIDNITVQKYFELCRKTLETEYLDKDNRPISFVDEIIGDELTVHSKVNLSDILNKENLTVIAALYTGDVLNYVSSTKCTGDDAISISFPNIRKDSRVKVFLWDDIRPIEMYKIFE